MAKTFAILTTPTGVTAIGEISQATYENKTEFGLGHDASGNVDATNAGKTRITANITVEFDVALTALLGSGGSLDIDYDGNGDKEFTVESTTRNESADSTSVNTFDIVAFFDVPTPVVP